MNVKDSIALNSIRGKVFVTTPSSYAHYFKRKDSDLNDKRKTQLANMKEYYSYMLSQPLVKRFDNGSGTAVEVYRITGQPAIDKNK